MESWRFCGGIDFVKLVNGTLRVRRGATARGWGCPSCADGERGAYLSQIVYKSFCKSQFPHKSVNFFFMWGDGRGRHAAPVFLVARGGRGGFNPDQYSSRTRFVLRALEPLAWFLKERLQYPMRNRIHDEYSFGWDLRGLSYTKCFQSRFAKVNSLKSLSNHSLY